MRLSVGEVLAQLRAEGLAPADADAAARAALADAHREELPWHMRAAIGFGAWLATVFLVGSVMAIGDLRDDASRTVLGALLIVGGVWLRRAASAEFLKQAAVAACLAGQALVILGVGDQYDSAEIAGLAGFALSGALIPIMPDRTHRFLSTVAGVISLAVAVTDMRAAATLDMLAVFVVALSAFLWRMRLHRRTAGEAEMLAPVSYALVVSLFGLLLFGTMATMDQMRWLVGDQSDIVPGRLTTSAITLALLALVWKILDEHGASASSGLSVAALAGVAALGASTLSSPGIVAGVAALILAFDRRDRVLLGMAVVFLLVFGSAYYYTLHLTLLEKSGVLAGSGLLLLAIRQRLAPTDAEAAP